MTRVIAGAARGRRLQVPPGDGTRPTSDRAREALFGTLESLLGAWAGRRVLDLYAGSGAVGLEALSRGAAHALLVEADARAARTLAANVATLGLAGAEVRRGRVERVAAHGLPGPAYDVVFADPPYDLTDDELRTVLADLRPGQRASGRAAPRAAIVSTRPPRRTARQRRIEESTTAIGVRDGRGHAHQQIGPRSPTPCPSCCRSRRTPTTCPPARAGRSRTAAQGLHAALHEADHDGEPEEIARRRRRNTRRRVTRDVDREADEYAVARTDPAAEPAERERGRESRRTA